MNTPATGNPFDPGAGRTRALRIVPGTTNPPAQPAPSEETSPLPPVSSTLRTQLSGWAAHALTMRDAMVALAAAARARAAQSWRARGGEASLQDLAKVVPFRRDRDDQKFLAPALEILETPPSPISMAFLIAICLLVTTAILWAWIGRVDIIATAQGKIQPTGRVKVIQPIETGRVAEIAVGDGAHVAQGDLLLALDTTAAEADVEAARSALASLRAESMRRQAAIATATLGDFSPLPEIRWKADTPGDVRLREDAVLRGDLGQLQATLASLDAQFNQKSLERDKRIETIETQKRLVATLQERVNMRTALVKLKAGAKAAVIDATETMPKQQTQLALQQEQLASDQSGLAVFQREKEKTKETFIADNAQKMAERARDIEAEEQKLSKALVGLDHMNLRSPIDGVVQASTITNIGQVVGSGQELMRVVPEAAPLEIQAYVRNEDIGFIKVDQQAIIKVAAFPFNRYGVVNARVTQVARDAIPEPDANTAEADPARSRNASGFVNAQRTQNLVFAVTLLPETTEIHVDDFKAPLSSGMAVTVEFKTGSRRILSELFSPILTTVSDSLHER